MNKKQQSSNKRRKRASIGLAVCFAAAIVLTGAYTWRNYRANVKDEQAKIEEEQQAKEEEIKRNTEETSSIAKKALEDEEPVTKEDSQAANTAADGSTENRMDTWETDSTQTAGTAMNLNFGEDSQLLWPVDGNVLMSYSMDKTVYFSTLDQYRYNPAMIISGAVNDNVIAAAPGLVKSIDNFAQTGITVTLDMGNGYECMYGQLKEVQVKVGDYLEAGNVIGYLEIPTKYYSLEGCNLYFEMLKDGQPVNPMDYLAEDSEQKKGRGACWSLFEAMNYTYILKCKDETLYTGWTNDIEKRLEAHNAGKGAKYTRSRRPVELVYLEQFETKEEAMRREYAIKHMTRRAKLGLVMSYKETGQ